MESECTYLEPFERSFGSDVAWRPFLATKDTRDGEGVGLEGSDLLLTRYIAMNLF